MFLYILKDRNYERLYIRKAVRTGDSVKSMNVKSLGRMDILMDSMNMSREQVIEWGKAQVIELEKPEKEAKVMLELSESDLIPKNVTRSFNAGYLFLQSLYYDLKIDNICRNIKNRHKFDYSLDAILSDLIYARILDPGSKRASYQFCQSLLEPPRYDQHDIYRALSVLFEEMDYIQAEVYKNSNFIVKRNNHVLYYDCTNYYFEIEQDDEFRKYGQSKEHRPNPIVQMGLFIDGDGIPLAFNVFPGNRNEQPSMKPLEEKIIKNFGFDRFVVCTDGGLGSDDNRLFNDIEGRAFIVTQSLKALSKETQASAMDNRNWRRLSDRKSVDITEIKEHPENHLNELYYKEEVYGTKKVPGQLMIVTYSPKYAVYNKNLRDAQVDRAEKMIEKGKKTKSYSNQNDPARFVRKTAVTDDGEVADKEHLSLDQEKIDKEAMYDGYYAICTDLVDDDVKDILDVSEGRWEIEESFRIMKTDFEARPVYLSRDDRITAHFLICYLALLIFRILEKQKLGEKYTANEIIKCLREYRLLKPNSQGYLPEYERTDLTDELHEVFQFRTDTEIVPTRTMKKIIASTKK